MYVMWRLSREFSQQNWRVIGAFLLIHMSPVVATTFWVVSSRQRHGRFYTYLSDDIVGDFWFVLASVAIFSALMFILAFVAICWAPAAALLAMCRANWDARWDAPRVARSSFLAAAALLLPWIHYRIALSGSAKLPYALKLAYRSLSVTWFGGPVLLAWLTSWYMLVEVLPILPSYYFLGIEARMLDWDRGWPEAGGDGNLLIGVLFIFAAIPPIVALGCFISWWRSLPVAFGRYGNEIDLSSASTRVALPARHIRAFGQAAFWALVIPSFSLGWLTLYLLWAFREW